MTIRPTYWQILFVGKDQKKSITKFIFIQHTLKLFPCLNNTISIVGVNHEDDTLCVLEIVSPQRSNLVLTTNIPYCKLNVLVFDCLNIETLRILVLYLGSDRFSYRWLEWLYCTSISKCSGVSLRSAHTQFHPTSACKEWWSFQQHQDQPSRFSSLSFPKDDRTISRMSNPSWRYCVANEDVRGGLKDLSVH